MQNLNSQRAANILESIAIKGVIARLEEKAVKNTDKILEIIAAANDFITLKQIQDATEIKPGIVSGSLVHLCKSGKIFREKVERVSGNGPKMQWAYKTLEKTEEKV
jgi:hypothetical protein